MEPDHVVRALDSSRKLSDDPLLPWLWGFDDLNVKSAWDLMTTADVSEVSCRGVWRVYQCFFIRFV